MSDRKQELQQRLAANRARRKAEERASTRPWMRRQFQTLLGSLQAACQRFELRNCWADQDWVPRWVQSSSIFRYAPPSAHWHRHVGDPRARRRAIVELLDEVCSPDQPVLLIYERDRLAVRLSREAAQRFAGEAIHPGATNAVEVYRDDEGATVVRTGGVEAYEIWLSDPQGAWIIRSGYNYSDLIYAEPPPRWTQEELREGRSCLRHVRCALIRRRVRYRLIYPPADQKPWKPLFRVPAWKKIKPPLSAALPHEPEDQRALIGGFIALHASRDSKLLVRAMAHAPAVPRLALSAGDLIDHLDVIISTASECLIHAAEGELVVSIGRKWVYGTN